MCRSFMCSLGAAALALGLSTAVAADYPTKAITMIVPQNTGGTNDIVARVVGQKLGEVLGKTVVVDNRPGAGGNIGNVVAAKAPKDGYTLLDIGRWGKIVKASGAKVD